MDQNRDLHAVKALPVATNKVVSLGLFEEYEILATAIVPNCPFRRAVVVPGLVYFEHIVHGLLVPKRCPRNTITRQRAAHGSN